MCDIINMGDKVKGGILTAQVLTVYILSAITPVYSSCDPTRSNSTKCEPEPDSDSSEDDTPMATYNSFYIFFIIFGVVGLPSVILLRVCWVRRLHAQQNGRIAQARSHLQQNNHGEPEVFTIAIDPETYLPSYEQCIVDSPPSYDELDPPPPYKLKKNKSSASLPSYSETDSSSYPVECMTSHNAEHSRSLPEDGSSLNQTNK